MRHRRIEDFPHFARKNLRLLSGGLEALTTPPARQQSIMRKTTRLRVRKQPLGGGLHRFSSRCPLGAELVLNCYRQQEPFVYLGIQLPRKYPRPLWLRELAGNL